MNSRHTIISFTLALVVGVHCGGDSESSDISDISDISEPDPCVDVTCEGHGECQSGPEGAACLCDEGYSEPDCAGCAAGYHPSDDDECTLDETCEESTCAGHGSCDDSTGLVTCSCEPGHIGLFCDTPLMIVRLFIHDSDGQEVGIAGVHVLRSNLESGALEAAIVTGADGVADFGDIGNDRATISLVFANAEEGGEEPGELFGITFRGVSTGTVRVNLDEDDDHHGDGEILASFDVELTNVPGGRVNTSVNLSGSDGFGVGGGSEAAFSGIVVGSHNLNDLGRFGLLAEALDEDGVVRCGLALDLGPASVDGTTLTVDLNRRPLAVPFTTSPPVLIGIGHNISYLWNGVRFESGHIDPTPNEPQSSGSLIFCEIPDSQVVMVDVQTEMRPRVTVRSLFRSSPTLPGRLDFEIPDVTIDDIRRQGTTVSFRSGGSDLSTVDFSVVHLEWFDEQTFIEWELIQGRDATSATIPELPSELTDLFVLPEDGLGIRVSLEGNDSFEGLDGLLEAFAETTNLENGFGAGFEAFQMLGALIIEPPDGGTVTADVGEIDCGAEGVGDCSADNISGGTPVTLTAEPLPGFAFADWQGAPCGGSFPPQNTCEFVFNETLTVVQARFAEPPYDLRAVLNAPHIPIEANREASPEFPMLPIAYYFLLFSVGEGSDFPESVTFSGPFGSDLNNTVSAYWGSGPDSAYYASPSIYVIPPDGTYVIDYKDEEVRIDVSLDAANRRVLPLPTVTVGDDDTIWLIDWRYVDQNGSTRSADFVTSVEVRISGATERLYDARGIEPDAMSHTPTESIDWSDVRSIELLLIDENENAYNSYWTVGGG